MKFTVETITPDLAAKWLDGNVRNRPIRWGKVALFSRIIRSGEWMLTHQGVAFADDGRLLDGQHRLLAIIDTGVTVEMVVARDCDPATFKAIDTDISVRVGSDILSIAGYEQHGNLPGAIKAIRLYDEHRDEAWSTARARLSNDEILVYAEKGGQPLVDAVTLARHVRTVARTGPYPSYGTAIYLIHRDGGVSPALQDQLFWGPYATGVGLGAGDPRLALKRTVDRNYVGARGTGGLPNTRHFLGLMLKAWNAYATGKPVQVLSYKDAEPMPDVKRMEVR